MKYLLDTHVLLWFFSSPEKLSETVRKIFLDNQSNLFLSWYSLWEITIKVSLGKLILAESWLELIESELQRNRIVLVNTTFSHLNELHKLPFHHRDPFDRMLISQAKVEKMTLLTSDRQISKYDALTLW